MDGAAGLTVLVTLGLVTHYHQLYPPVNGVDTLCHGSFSASIIAKRNCIKFSKTGYCSYDSVRITFIKVH